jgi:hypothetical protein
MATTEETISSLILYRNTLAAHTSGLSPAAGQYLWTAIDDINDEIDQLTANALATAPYVPQTDPFKSITDAGKQFIGTLSDIKQLFSNLDDVVKAAQSVIGIILAI